MLTFMLASATVALRMAYLPMLTGSVLISVSIPTQHLTDNSVNRLHKANRLDAATFLQRWNGAATTVTQPTRSSQPIPDGCNPAFGRSMLLKIAATGALTASTL